jgi:3-oxoacyl-[acyl-carrier-protein] synthase-1
MKTAAVVVGVGAFTSVGPSARDTGFLLRTGSAGMTEASLVDRNDEPITMCLVPTLDPLLVGPGRALRLAIPAMEEALGAIGEVAAQLRMRVVLAVDEYVAEKRADGVVPANVLLSMVGRRAKELCPRASVELCARGAAGPGFVLPDLLNSLANGETDAVLLGGTHTDYDPAVVATLEARDRIYTPGNLDALIPGELAAFALLMRPDVARRFRLTAYARVHEVGTAFEKATPDNDHPRFEALGLTVAIRKAAAPLVEQNARAGWILNDMTFELRRLYEWQAVTVRTQKFWCEPQMLDTPAHKLGHLGAAAMPLHFALASTAWRHGYAPHGTAMVIAGSDPGERSAVLLSQEDGR